MSTKESLLAHLKQVVGDDSEAPWSDDNIPYLFQRFRPDGDGLEEAISLMPNASGYVARLLRVYQATKHEDWARDMYFVVRNAHSAKECEIVTFGQQFLANLRLLANVIGNNEFSSYLASVTSVEVISPALLDRNADDNLLLYDSMSDFLDRHILHEAYYSIACDFDLLWYLVWPLHEHLCAVDCFEPYFQLWQHGYRYAFDGSTLKLAKA